jgi:twinfilin-like protein
MSSPPPLTASEKALADVKAAEAEESRREQLGGAQRRGNAVVPVKMKWSEELVAALKGLQEPVQGSSETGKIVCVVSLPLSLQWFTPADLDQQIDPKTETLTLHLSKTVATSAIASTLPPSAPCFTFYAWPGTATTASSSTTPAAPAESESEAPAVEQERRGSPATAPKILFIYTCPSSSPVRHRMLYSSSVQFVIKESEAQTGVVVSKKVLCVSPRSISY